MLTDQAIKAEVDLRSAYGNGCTYFSSGFVKNLRKDDEFDFFSAQVKGGSVYEVEVEVDADGDIVYYDCTCQAFEEYDGACKHIVAVLKAIQSRWHEYFGHYNGNIPALSGNGLSASTQALFEFFSKVNSEDLEEHTAGQANTRVVPALCLDYSSRQARTWLEFSVGHERLYIMKSVKKFLEALLTQNQLTYGKNFTFDPTTAVFDQKSQELINLLKTAYYDENKISSGYYYGYNYNSVFGEERKFKLSNSNLLKFLEIMQGESFAISLSGRTVENVKIIDGRPDLRLDVAAGKDGLKVRLDLLGSFYPLDYDLKYVFCQNAIYQVDPLFARYVVPLMKCFGANNKGEFQIPPSGTHAFLESVVPEIEKIVKVKLSAALTKSFYREALEKQVYFDRHGQGIAARIVFQYGDEIINPAGSGESSGIVKKGRNLLRETAEENRLLHIFKKYGFAAAGDLFVQGNEERAYDFLTEGLAAVRESAEVFYTDAFKNICLGSSGKISAGVRINTDSGLLEMRMQYEDMEPKEFMELLASYKLKKRYHRLKNGRFISLDASGFQSAAELIDQLNLSPSDLTKKVIELPKYRAMYIDSLAREKKSLFMERSGSFKKMVQDVSEPQDMEFELPEGINGKLRDYQKTGYKWLKTLAYYGFGGILADDMGLGKTLQVITFVKSENQGEKRPSLVIVPTSLVYNWQEEVNKFAPDLTVTVLSGMQAYRRERFAEIENSDLVVTSYGMIKRDIGLYEDYTFRYCFIDEAQHIKNPHTQNAKAVKQIKAGGFFALTGTPVENTLTELWSIFDFIMPGYLLSHNKFTARFETPIIKSGDQNALKELGRHIQPFILRRLKKEVLKELPEKIESKMTNEMTAEQKKIYTAFLLKAKKEFEQELAENGFENSRIKILAILTRLRQVCCHPGLFLEDYQGGSGKLEMLLELLEDAVKGGHRILVFSQFTSMLALIRNELEKVKVKYHYLDGSTAAEERLSLVNAFNGGDKEIFLISLKAGGTGLNLTGADMVVHFDPWWNPAVEDQATDRAYRIGQKNTVQVFKLITKDTIEEKIFELQQKKKELIDAVIKPGENFLTKMTEEEIRKLFEVG